jgi:tetratricopeptide (TPR) repeat protein
MIDPSSDAGLRLRNSREAVMAAYRPGDYSTALSASEGLKDGTSKTGPYCFYRGTMLHLLGRLNEAESILREGLLLEKNPRLRALAANTLATVLMDQERFAEAVELYQLAHRAWSDRGSSIRGIAEVWLRQGREFPEALKQAQRAVAIDKRASGLSKEALEHRLGEDLAVLAWALAANSAGAGTVDFLVAEALRLCSSGAKAILAQVHCHAGQAYLVIQNIEKSRGHFYQAAEIDPQGIFGAMARSTISRLPM